MRNCTRCFGIMEKTGMREGIEQWTCSVCGYVGANMKPEVFIDIMEE